MRKTIYEMRKICFYPQFLTLPEKDFPGEIVVNKASLNGTL